MTDSQLYFCKRPIIPFARSTLECLASFVEAGTVTGDVINSLFTSALTAHGRVDHSNTMPANDYSYIRNYSANFKPNSITDLKVHMKKYTILYNSHDLNYKLCKIN